MAPALQIYATPTIPTNLSSGANQDPTIVISQAELIRFAMPPEFTGAAAAVQRRPGCRCRSRSA